MEKPISATLRACIAIYFQLMQLKELAEQAKTNMTSIRGDLTAEEVTEFNRITGSKYK